jgi:hypothetical protein
MGWTRYDSDAPRYDDPQLTVYSNLNGYVNAAADHQWLSEHDWVDIHTDSERDLVAIEPQSDEEGTLMLSRENGRGADVSFKPALQHDLALDPDDIEETHHVPLEWDDEHGWAVADLSALRDGETGDHEPTKGGRRGDDLDTGARWCPCGFESDSERGISIHQARTHDNADDYEILTEPPADDEDGEDQEDDVDTNEADDTD